MNQDTFPMTEEGLEHLKLELNVLETEKREKAKERIKYARSFCDFREDSEYATAIKAMESIEERISVLKYKIQYAKVIEKTQSDQITIGSTVTFQEVPKGDHETYTIVGTEEADVLEGKISHDSPMAKSLIGCELNEQVSVVTPNGKQRIKILNIF